MAPPPNPHHTLTTSFSQRAELPNTPPLIRYLLSLISIKRSNLCVSADVHTTLELIRLAEEVGDHICILKTHADIIDDWSKDTITALQAIAKRKHFLLFEDRKFADIGSPFLSLLAASSRPSPFPPTPALNQKQLANLSLELRLKTDTLQSQYTRGPLQIAIWAHLTNAHLLPGPAIVPALRAAAQQHLLSLNQSVNTTITAGPPPPAPESSTANSHPHPPSTTTAAPTTTHPPPPSPGSVSATTTITQHTHSLPTSAPPTLLKSLSQSDATLDDIPSLLTSLGPPPHARGLLLLAQMSSAGNLITSEYTAACLEAARENRDFVLGFICQEGLNREEGDNFLCLAPGVGLPPAGEKESGDGKGQVWRHPKTVVGEGGVDVVIVGRGVLGAEDRGGEAERYRVAAWEAYEGRVGVKS